MPIQVEPSLFIAMLDRKREVMGLDHTRFAEAMGVSGAHWSFLRHGKRRFSLDFAQRICDRWPEFGGYLAAEMSSRSQHGQRAREAAVA